MRKIIILFLSFLSLAAYSQTNTISPYSRYGLGDLAHEGTAANRAMGGTGIGLRLPNTINFLNPASYTAIDTMSFIFDFGLYSNFVNYKTSSATATDNRSSLNYLTLGFPVTKWWKSSLGLVPYSRMGYNITDLKFINYREFNPVKSELYDLYYDGTGGINKFYLGNAFSYKNLSVGVNLNVLFGSLEQKYRFNETNLEAGTSATNREQQQSIKSTSLTFGLQYNLKVADDVNIVLGGIFEGKSRLKTDDYMLVVNEFFKDTLTGNGYQKKYIVDTVDFRDKSVKNNIPMKFGGGISINIKNKILLSADYTTQQWSDFSSINLFDDLADSKSLNFGLQYTPDEKSIRSYWKRIGIRAGYYNTDTYIKVRGQQINDSGLTLGLRMPFKGYRSAFHISYEYGKRGSTNLLQENYHFLNVGISLYDFWFIKTKYD